MSLPSEPPSGASGVPERRLTTQQMEVVIRRAVELQAGASDPPPEEGIGEAELVRIAREIGVAPQYMQRALAELAPAAPPAGRGERLFGPGWVRAGRAVPGSRDAVAEHVDRYLVEREWLAPVRRFADRTVYRKASGVDLVRVLDRIKDDVIGTRQPQVGAGFKLKRAREVEVAVRPLEEGYSYLSIAVDLSSLRSATAATGAVMGSGGGVAVAAFLGIAVDPVAALLGIPVLGGGLWTARAVQVQAAAQAQTHLESLLDCLERGEPLVRPRPGRG